MDKTLPNVEKTNDTGACWTCLKGGRLCDGALPRKPRGRAHAPVLISLDLKRRNRPEGTWTDMQQAAPIAQGEEYAVLASVSASNGHRDFRSMLEPVDEQLVGGQ
jgi:hypothetical protein